MLGRNIQRLHRLGGRNSILRDAIKSAQQPSTALNRIRNRRLFPEYDFKNFHHENVAIFPELKIVFNRIKKSGNTTVTAILYKAENRSIKGAQKMKNELLIPVNMSKDVACELSEYFSFVFCRDPYARILSAFRDKVGRGTHSYTTLVPGYGDDSPDGFKRFLYFCRDGGLYFDRHWWPQVDLLYKPSSAFDYIGRVENLSNDMNNVIEAAGLDGALRDSIREAYSANSHITSSTDRLAEYYDRDSMKIVLNLYERCFNEFNYDGNLRCLS